MTSNYKDRVGDVLGFGCKSSCHAVDYAIEMAYRRMACNISVALQMSEWTSCTHGT